MAANFQAIDDEAAMFDQGTLASRGVATTSGKLYFATDVGVLLYADGSTWTVLGAAVGAVDFTAAASAPTGWILANGAAVSRTAYARLFAAIGTTYGAGDGTTTFNLPDLRGRVPLGVGTLAADTYALANTGGEARHVLTTAEVAAHTHSGPSHTHTGPSHSHGDGTLSAASAGSHNHDLPPARSSGASHTHHGSGGSDLSVQATTGDNSSWTKLTSSETAHTHSVTGTTATSGTAATGASGTAATGSTGSGTAHENRQPYLALNPIIFTGVV